MAMGLQAAVTVNMRAELRKDAPCILVLTIIRGLQ
jgi:hypothetical protein